jgi:hypothetical protein
MKLGLVAESQRPPDSPDSVLVVEPSIGSTTRTKGNLYLLVTGAGGGELRPATNMVAERVRHEYYYDESAGIAICLKKAIRAADRELRMSAKAGAPAIPPGVIGIALAVVRGNELYVVTVGPAEAYLVRQARLLTLPDPSPDSGLPAENPADPEVWHGDLALGDSLILISPNATRRIGLAPIQDAVIQLHPQVAIEQIHRQLTGGGIGIAGGDGMIALEAHEVSTTQKTQPLKPVWPSDALAGVPERSPIPLADTVSDGVTAMQHTAKQVQRTADGMLRHSVYGLFDRMPRRPVQRVRITPIAVQRERQRRLASAIVGMLVILTIVGTSLWFLAGTRRTDGVDQQQRGQTAYSAAVTEIFQVYGNDRDLMISNPAQGAKYLEDAYKNLQVALQNGYSADSLSAMTSTVVAGLNDYYRINVLTPQVVLSFGGDDLSGLVLGGDGGAYLIDHTNDTVYRVDLVTRAKAVVAIKGEAPDSGGVVGTPLLLTSGGPDVLILDSANAVWRWRPGAAATAGQGTLLKLNITDSGTWGTGVRAFGTFVTDALQGQYTIYVVVPSAGQIIKYPPAGDGSGYPSSSKLDYMSASEDVNLVTDMYIDGSVYLLNKGQVERFDAGQRTIRGWTADLPRDKVMRPAAPVYTSISADNPISDQGNLYAYDNTGRRVISLSKNNGTFVQEYVLPGNSTFFTALKGMFIRTGPNGSSPTLFWVESGNLMSAALPVPAGAATPTPKATPAPPVKATPTPKLKPTPIPTPVRSPAGPTGGVAP